MSRPDVSRTVAQALDTFRIELPSWGFANTGTRFGKFLQAAAATTIEEKCSDAGQVNALTGACPTIALHVLWDCPRGLDDVETVRAAARAAGLEPGAINPNVFQDQHYKFGSFGNPDPRSAAAGDRSLHRQRPHCGPAEVSRPVAVVCGRFELPGHRQHPSAQALVRRGAVSGACRLES